MHQPLVRILRDLLARSELAPYSRFLSPDWECAAWIGNRLGELLPLSLPVRQALLVLSNIPLAMIGGVFGLLIAGEYLSVPASVGFIALLGIAVLNGVVMVTYFNQLLARGMPVAEVVVEGARRRLRPVLMTANIAAFGLVPMLFATGPGSEVQRPLAIVVIGGLVSSTALTLVLLPILFRRFGVNPTLAFTENAHA